MQWHFYSFITFLNNEYVCYMSRVVMKNRRTNYFNFFLCVCEFGNSTHSVAESLRSSDRNLGRFFFFKWNKEQVSFGMLNNFHAFRLITFQLYVNSTKLVKFNRLSLKNILSSFQINIPNNLQRRILYLNIFEKKSFMTIRIETVNHLYFRFATRKK